MSRNLRNVGFIGFQEQLEEDLTKLLTEVVRSNPGMKHKDAFKKVTQAMLENNPFVPPKGCPINDLPNELLGYIFQVGLSMADDEDEWDEEDEYDDDDDDSELESESEDDEPPRKQKGKGQTTKKEPGECEEGEAEKERKEKAIRKMPFQMLVSHVCKHWREVALETPTLWTSMSFCYGSSIDSAKTWVERSKNQPLEIDIDCSLPEDEPILRHEDGFSDDELVEDYEHEDEGGDHPNTAQTQTSEDLPIPSKSQIAEFLNVVMPHVNRWQSFRLTASHYDRIFLVLERLSQCQSAPALELLELSNHDDQEDYETFPQPEYKQGFLLFNGNAPNLKFVRFWGVHLDWDASLSFMKGLREIELAYHTNDVRPSFGTFANMVTASPDLETLSLATSGPMRSSPESPWPETQRTIEIPSLKELVLAQHEQEYIMNLLSLLSTPNVVSLNLDFDSQDFTELAMLLAKPLHDRRAGSLLSGLQQLKISGMPCNTKAREAMLEQLVNLKIINLNCCDEEEVEFFDLIKKMKPSPDGNYETPGPSVLYCPNLISIYTTGIDGKQMKAFIEARRQGGVPVKRVGMSEDDDVEEREEKWLKEHVEEVEFFEPDSDFEEAFVEIEDEFSDIDSSDDDPMETDAD
ncbi:hypothetical protein E1B28_012455 [Marasmius oreades]|uniref:F-box domain-containing protein n=1 Tax=Marasmius oreades TaxID=181124 RepID=A0A9P7RRH4_9AGAR|nr:uncharacterized protein E1B28_012455 [Marasmius oreades]KAG7088466.1 hypothetical protein E1B28_012455 [Marasmius oreades]